MDFGSIAGFLKNKTILITGATGFIAKSILSLIFFSLFPSKVNYSHFMYMFITSYPAPWIYTVLLEKILRIQPNVDKLYLLIRARDAQAANVRLQNEVLGKELFRILREKMGAEFESFILRKMTLVVGDTSYENLGLVEDELMKMYQHIDIVINVAATTKFVERYDVALGVNTLGVKNVVNFAKNCANMELLIHVSTAYVCGEKAGLISENSYAMGQSLSGVAGLDIDSEKKLVEQTLSSLIARDLPEKTIGQMMKNLGSQRAKLYGWPNTYVFTKAMGEMLVGQLRGNLPVVIMRPTIVCSTLKEPFPGWVENCRTIDSFAVSYGKGYLKFIAGDYTTILDLIPADMFVNSILVAMKAHANQPYLTVYHVGSSFKNPLSFKEVHEYFFYYFKKNPWQSHEGNIVKVRTIRVLSNIQIFKTIVFLWHTLVQMISIFSGKIGCNYMESTMSNIGKKLKLAMNIVEVYKPYVFFKGIFVDTNTEKLLMTAHENGLDEDVFDFDPLHINWKDYFINIHLPAVVKYLF